MAKTTKTEVVFSVRMILPEGANVSDAQTYIKDAIVGWGGGGDVEDPFFGLTTDEVRVALQKKTSVTTYNRTK